MTQNLIMSTMIIEELTRLGVSRFVISSGSRSTPLTVAAARKTEVETTIHFDERGAAYFALGQAKASGKPSALICTSGTAVANYFPALIEASMDNIPLIVLTADRPPELIDVGANQAIFQENIFGKYPRISKNLPPPDDQLSFEQLLTDVDTIYDAATGSRPGPVHLNCQLREPLLPRDDPTINYPEKLSSWASSKLRYTKIPNLEKSDNNSVIETINGKNRESHHGLIVVGRAVNSKYDDTICEWAKSMNWPVFADVQSNLRFSTHPNIINRFDLALLRKTAQDLKPDVVIHLGGPITSKRLLNYLKDCDPFYISAKQTPERVDPNHQVDLSLINSFDDFFNSVAAEAQNLDSSWLSSWQVLEAETKNLITSHIDLDSTLNEPGVSSCVSKLIGRQHSLMLANSMSIREMEMFAAESGFSGPIIVNRGASGIDGLIATAAGHQSTVDQPMTLLIGDLAALHDLNSFALLKNMRSALIIILINNNGGGIFNFLPVSTKSDVFESYFGTPHGLNFSHLCAMFDLEYSNPDDMSKFKKTYLDATQNNKSMIIEINTDRYENRELHQQIFDSISES